MDAAKTFHVRQAANILYPANFPDLFSGWARFPDAAPCAGGLELLRNQGRRTPVLPKNILSLDKMSELHRYTRTERYLELGAIVTLNEIIALGKIVPRILSACLMSAADPQIRNAVTIGGCLCNPLCPGASAPMVALDAHYELRGAYRTRQISAARFSAVPGRPALDKGELLTRVRIPLEQWDYSLLGKLNAPGERESLVILLIKTQKNILSDLRLVYGGDAIIRDSNSEALLAGKKLPLGRREVRGFAESWGNFLSGIEDATLSAEDRDAGFIRAKILNFIESSLREFAD